MATYDANLVRNTAVASLTVGVLSHWLYFIHGEHHMQAVRLAQLSIIVPCVLFVAWIRFTGAGVSEAMFATTAVISAYFGGLWTSMLIYRAFFHRLRKFPGPFGAKLTKFWHVAQLGGLDNYKRLDKWHSQYGDFVRIGPTELAIVEPDAVEAIMGARSKCIKAPWYDIADPLVSMHQCRDRNLHDIRRRVWDRGFSVKALSSYEIRVKNFAIDLVDKIAAFNGKPLNASKWFNYYSFDVMGELAFGKSFDMLAKGESHYAIEYLSEGTKPVGIFSPMPWLMIILTRIPGLSAAYQRWIDFCEEQAENRKKMEVRDKDVMSWLLEAEPMSTDPYKEKMWLIGDSRLIIVAGSDTTAATLTHLFYHLAEDPSQVEKLRKELDPLKNDVSGFDTKELGNADHLNGLINETLRLHPPVPSGLSRQTPPEGLQIGETFVPGDVIVSVPLWTVGRSPKAWEKPNEMIPERWYSQPELIKNKNAYAPFSIGRYGCIGKNLALMELRTVTADLITRFDVKFAPKEDGSTLLNKSEDYFTLGLADLMLEFHERKS